MKTTWIIALCLLILTGCNTEQIDDSKSIAISWYYPNSDYQDWVRSQDSSFVFVELYSLKPTQIDSALNAVDGIILTGGPDVQPKYFGTVDSLALCGKPNALRDSIELLSAEYAIENKKPILGVCRGMQVMNISLGGDLYLDIPSQLNSSSHKVDGTDAKHFVYAVSDRFHSTFSSDSGWTNSNHHQALKNIGTGLEIDGITKDSVVEAVSLADSLNHPFFRAVQWHPERMERESAMAANILAEFLKAVGDE